MTIDDIALTLQPGLGHKGIKHLLSYYRSASDVFDSTLDELTNKAGLREDMASKLLRKQYHRQAEVEIEYLSRHGLYGVAATDKEYPVRMLDCPDYPHVMYYRGDIGILSSSTVAMVGTRAASQYGMRMSDVIVGQIAEETADAVVVSGLAFGIDACCHRAALEYGLKTAAVVACSLPDVTPPQNSRLADEIIDAGGVIVSELNSQTKQNGNYFLPRNRILAGVSEGTLVIESPTGGGSLYTAEYAYGYDRVVMALPGRVGDRCSEGSNRLIRDRKASLVCSGADVMRELGWDIADVGTIPSCVKEQAILSSDERRIVECFKEGETLGVSVLAMRSGMSIGEVTALLLSLEIGGIVISLPGKMYEKRG